MGLVSCLHTVKCQTSSILNNSVYQKYTVSMSKTVLFQTIQFSISTQLNSVWLIGWTLSGTTTPGQSGPGSYGNERILRILQSSSITEAWQSDCLESIQDTRWGGILLLCWGAMGVFYSHNPLVKQSTESKVVGDDKVKLSPFGRGWPEGSLSNSYYTEV